MPANIDRDRRRFLTSAAIALTGGPLGVSSLVRASGRAPRDLTALDRATEWLNSPRLTAANLQGRVVLVDFCTYTCINWLRTLPYRRAWARKYAPALVMIGVHTPEFTFEKDIANVRRAVQQLRIDYPIAIDNDHVIWRAFNNQYWPALYFLDARGKMRQHHFGEGEYERSELAIQRLLTEAGAAGRHDAVVSVSGTGVEAAPDWGNLRSPEKYLGHDRTDRLASPGGAALARRRVYAAPEQLTLNQWALAGEWTIGREATVLDRAGGRISCRFHARDVHLVMRAPRRPVQFRVRVDGQPPGPARGGDLDERGDGTVADARLYQLVRQLNPIVERLFEIEFLDAGVETFALTFG